MRLLIFSALLLCATGCVLAMASDAADKIETNDDATLDILNLADTEGRIIKVDELITIIDSDEIIAELEKANLHEKLTILTPEHYNEVVSALILRGETRTRKYKGGKKSASKKNKGNEVAAAILLVADKLELQIKEMKSSGETQQNAYKQQVKTATRSTYAAIATGALAVGSVLFNILQGFGVFGGSDACDTD